MPLYRIRSERCTQYTLVVEASSAEEAKQAVDGHEGEWNTETVYWRDLETHELEAEDWEEPDVRVPPNEEAK